MGLRQYQCMPCMIEGLIQAKGCVVELMSAVNNPNVPNQVYRQNIPCSIGRDEVVVHIVPSFIILYLVPPGRNSGPCMILFQTKLARPLYTHKGHAPPSQSQVCCKPSTSSLNLLCNAMYQ